MQQNFDFFINHYKIKTMLEAFFIQFLPEWAADAVVDSIKTIPFLFLVFLFIELFEHFWANKIKSFLKASKNLGPFVGSLAASIPQCGFSIVASTLYTKKFITRGTIIAVYLATSDEAIPVLLMYPEYLKYILPLILIKLVIAIPVGYLVDFLLNSENETENIEEEENIEGCCRHEIVAHKKTDFLIHPTKHTINIFLFILVLTLILNYLLNIFNIEKFSVNGIHWYLPLITSILGLIPNCAISVGLVLLFIKGAISFGALISGLMTNGGIGLLVLLKNNKNKKDTVLILTLLVLIGFFVGGVVQVLFTHW